MQNQEKKLEKDYPIIFFYIALLKKWKKLFTFNFLVITLIATIIAFVLPKWYYSSAVLKPNEDGNLNMFSAILGAKGLSSIGKNLNVGGLQYSDLDYYKSLLSSRKVTIEIINKYDLRNVYDNTYLFQTINELLANSDFQIDTKSNLLIIGVFDQQPERAKKMVESYLKFLDETIAELNDFSKHYNRKYIEDRYNKNRFDMETAENNLKEFQQKYHVVLPEEQFKSTIEVYAKLEAEKLLIDVQIKGLSTTPERSQLIVESLIEQKKVLEKKMTQLQTVGDNIGGNRDLFIPLGTAPELIKKYLGLYREIEIQNKLLEILYPVYQQAIMDEGKKVPAFVVIDTPYLPEYKAKPKRLIIILSGVVLSLLISLLIAASTESLSKYKKRV